MRIIIANWEKLICPSRSNAWPTGGDFLWGLLTSQMKTCTDYWTYVLIPFGLSLFLLSFLISPKKKFRLYSSLSPFWLFVNFSVCSYLSVFSSVFPYVYHSVCQFSFLFSFLPSFLPSPLYQLLFFPIHSLNLSHSPKLLPTPHFPSFPYFF